MEPVGECWEVNKGALVLYIQADQTVLVSLWSREITRISRGRGSRLCLLPTCCPRALCSPVSSAWKTAGSFLVLQRENPGHVMAASGCVSAGGLSQRPDSCLSSDPAAGSRTSLLTCSELLAFPSTSVPAHSSWFSSLHSFVLLNETMKEKIPPNSPGGSVRSTVTLILIPARPGRGSWCCEWSRCSPSILQTRTEKRLYSVWLLLLCGEAFNKSCDLWDVCGRCCFLLCHLSGREKPGLIILGT